MSIADSRGSLLDMGTPFDYFGELAQPRYEERFLQEGRLTKEQLNNRKLLRDVMHQAGFRGIPDEWWHFNGFSLEEVKRRYAIVEFLVPLAETEDVLLKVKDLPRDENGMCILIKGSEKKMYLIENNTIKLVFDVALGKGGLGKKKEGDHKTPLGDYWIKWMVSSSGPPKSNPGGSPALLSKERPMQCWIQSCFLVILQQYGSRCYLMEQEKFLMMWEIDPFPGESSQLPRVKNSGQIPMVASGPM